MMKKIIFLLFFSLKIFALETLYPAILPSINYILFDETAISQNIYIIGDSTVHRDNINCDDCEETEGWGDELNLYAHSGTTIFNRARAGSSAESYREIDTYYGADRYWGDTVNKIESSTKPSFLLIQFGSSNEVRLYDARYPRLDDNAEIIDYNGDGIGNEDDEESRVLLIKNAFKLAVAFYLDESVRLGVTPILLSPPNSKYAFNTRGEFPQYIEELAKERGVAYLNLHQKSLDIFADYTYEERIALFGLYREDGSIDSTHYNVQGAQIVASWVRDLACDNLQTIKLCRVLDESKNILFTGTQEYSDISLGEEVLLDAAVYQRDSSTFFYRWEENGVVLSDTKTLIKSDFSLGLHRLTLSINDDLNHTIVKSVEIQVDDHIEQNIIHEDAEDGDITGWYTYATTEGSTISNIDENGNHVIELHGDNGTENGFSFSNLNMTEGFVVSWRLNYSEDFRFFVQVRSTNSPDETIYMEYTPDRLSRGLDGRYIHYGLGEDAKDGSWHTFTRDIEADFHTIYPDDNITLLIGFAIRGSGRIDDIQTSTRGAYRVFMYGGHRYEIVKTPHNWQDASNDAQLKGGYLAHISSIAENHEIYSRLYRYITKDEYENTVASNGGGASYVWIGANDIQSEGSWEWIENTELFWSGTSDGNALNGLYSNWGRDKDEVQREPDNASNQDAAAIALTEWQLGSGNLGQASQWNDLIASDALYTIIEYDDSDFK